MHETHLIHDLMRKVEAIARDQNARKVVSVKLRLGALCHMSAEHFREHFDEESKGTIADGARLEVDVSTDEDDPQAQDIMLESVEVED